MLEDKLTRAERIRLESLSQAVSMAEHIRVQGPTQQDIFEDAEKIEAWLKCSNGN